MLNSLLKRNKILIFLVLFVFGGTIAEPLLIKCSTESESCKFGLYAARKKRNNNSKKKKQTEEKKQETAEKADESDYLTDQEEALEYVPDIYRCAECGYEQDTPGTCPDHTTAELVKIADKARNPLAPVEYDGNEDIIVDIPLKNVVFRKEQLVEEKKSEESTENKTNNKK